MTLIESKNIESLKWIALLSMTGDHINKYLFNGTLPYLFEIGRIAFPIFTIVLAFNLARPGAVHSGAIARTCKRLFVFALISNIPFILLGGVRFGWWPLNVLWLFFFSASCIYMLEQKKLHCYFFALILFLAGSVLCEYWLFGMALFMFAWCYFKTGRKTFAIPVFISLASLQYVSGNEYALLSIPVLFVVTQMHITLPRLKYAFYVFYPLHLAILLLVRIPMTKAGYLFFM